ncbi:MAG TPA: SPOR domain-containing protein, partial [Gammaproteobacteria bacterium]|nr:SPOR domain-containing protein [Gammaproteobacteria bacterium]
NKPDAKPDIKPDTKPVPVVKPAAAPVPVKPVVKPVVTVPPVVTPKPVVPAPAPVAPVVNKPVPVAPVTTPAVAPVVVPSPTPVTPTESITNSSLSAEAANTVYTVQAGVFENRDNAMKLVNELNNKGFDAYVDEVVTGSGDSKFNVRFGRHSDREQVQRKLTRFKQLYTTSAYIIVLDQ